MGAWRQAPISREKNTPSQCAPNLKGKEVKTMTYNKPEIVNMVRAVTAIQGGTDKSRQVFTDADPTQIKATSMAYEADE